MTNMSLTRKFEHMNGQAAQLSLRDRLEFLQLLHAEQRAEGVWGVGFSGCLDAIWLAEQYADYHVLVLQAWETERRDRFFRLCMGNRFSVVCPVVYYRCSNRTPKMWNGVNEYRAENNAQLNKIIRCILQNNQ